MDPWPQRPIKDRQNMDPWPIKDRHIIDPWPIKDRRS